MTIKKSQLFVRLYIIEIYSDLTKTHTLNAEAKTLLLLQTLYSLKIPSPPHHFKNKNACLGISLIEFVSEQQHHRPVAQWCSQKSRLRQTRRGLYSYWLPSFDMTEIQRCIEEPWIDGRTIIMDSITHNLLYIAISSSSHSHYILYELEKCREKQADLLAYYSSCSVSYVSFFTRFVLHWSFIVSSVCWVPLRAVSGQM